MWACLISFNNLWCPVNDSADWKNEVNIFIPLPCPSCSVPEDYIGRRNLEHVEALQENPVDPNQVVIGYGRGLMVIWDLEKQCALQHIPATQVSCPGTVLAELTAAADSGDNLAVSLFFFPLPVTRSNWRACGGRRTGATSSARTATAATAAGRWARETRATRRRSRTSRTVRAERRPQSRVTLTLSLIPPVKLITAAAALLLFLTAGHFPCKAITKIIQLPTQQGWVWCVCAWLCV